MAYCTLHYACDPSGSYGIACGRLTQMFADRLRELYPRPPPGVRFRRPGQDDSASGSDEDGPPPAHGDPAAQGADDPPPAHGGPAAQRPVGAAGAVIPAHLGDPDHLADPALWASVAELQWALASDLAIRPPALFRTISRLRADGAFWEVRRSILALAAALTAAYPFLRAESPSDLLQLVALGSDMALAAAQDKELLLFVKNELQDVDLALALGA